MRSCSETLDQSRQLLNLVAAAWEPGDYQQSPLERLQLVNGSFQRIPSSQTGHWEGLQKRVRWLTGSSADHEVCQRLGELARFLEGIPGTPDFLKQGDDWLQKRIAPLSHQGLTTQAILKTLFEEKLLREGPKQRRLELYQERLHRLKALLDKLDEIVPYHRPTHHHEDQNTAKRHGLKPLEDIDPSDESQWQNQYRLYRSTIVHLLRSDGAHRYLKKLTVDYSQQDVLYSAWKKYLKVNGGLRLFHHRLHNQGQTQAVEFKPLSLLALLSALKESRGLKHLDFDSLPLKGEVCQEAVLATLGNNPGLEQLRLAHNEMEPEFLPRFLDQAEQLKQLKTLDLSDLPLSQEAESRFTQWVESCRHLSHLTLDRSALAGPLFSKLASSQKALPALKYLSLRDVTLSKEEKAALKSLIRNLPRLKEIYLSGNDFSVDELALLRRVDSDIYWQLH